MEFEKPNTKKRSLGSLRRNTKTKPRSPDLAGQLRLQRHTMEAIAKQFEETGSDEIVCCLAGSSITMPTDHISRLSSPRDMFDMSIAQPSETICLGYWMNMRKYNLKLFRRTPPDSSTAFRLPKELLASIDSICNDLDLTRSQLFRRSVTEFIKTLGHERSVQDPNHAQVPKVEQRGWSPELYDRLQRRR